MSTSFLELQWRSSWGFIWIKLPLPLPFPLGFLHSNTIRYHMKNILTPAQDKCLEMVHGNMSEDGDRKDQTGNHFSPWADFCAILPRFFCCCGAGNTTTLLKRPQAPQPGSNVPHTPQTASSGSSHHEQRLENFPSGKNNIYSSFYLHELLNRKKTYTQNPQKPTKQTKRR